jgi:hypothetical protein
VAPCLRRQLQAFPGGGGVEAGGRECAQWHLTSTLLLTPKNAATHLSLLLPISLPGQEVGTGGSPLKCLLYRACSQGQENETTTYECKGDGRSAGQEEGPS